MRDGAGLRESETSDRTLSLSIAAKINLDLRVLGRRHDGYHELLTLFQSVDLRDDLVVEPAAEGVLEVEVEPAGVLPPSPDNLVVLAGRALWRAAGGQPGARVRLRKRIPVGGGMGGGSADCAAALVAFDHLWGLGTRPEDLQAIAASLGSDVPFFLHGGTAVGRGRGERIEPLQDPLPTWVVIAVPPVEISTAVVFPRLSRRGPGSVAGEKVYAGFQERPPRIEWAALDNDLSDPVRAGWPMVDEAVTLLEASAPLTANVTGSGAAAFAVFAQEGAAREAASKMPSGLRLEVVRTLKRDEARPRIDRVARVE